MKKTFLFIALFLVLLPILKLQAQGTATDYRRAYSLPNKFGSQNVYFSPSDIQWQYRGHILSFYENSPEGAHYVIVNADSLTRRTYKTRQERDRLLGYPTFEEKKDKADELPERLRKPQPERHWMDSDDEREGEPILSPDGKYYAYTREGNVYLCERNGDNERALTQDGTLGLYYSCYLYWSPDSRFVAFQRIRPIAAKRYVRYIQSSPDTQLQPISYKLEYAKPGDELPFRTPCISEVSTGRLLVAPTTLFSKQYNLTRPAWDADSRSITFEYNQRGHQVYRVLEFSALTGNVRTLIEETSKTFINYNRHFRYDFNNGHDIIWMSERNNWNHLYLYDRRTAKVVKQLTKGAWVVRRVEKVDEEAGTLIFSASGMHAGEDPYNVHYYLIHLDGSHLVSLTPEVGNHSISLSDDGKYLVDTYSSPTDAPTCVLRDGQSGRVIIPLAHADISKLTANGWVAPEPFSAPGRDGKTLMYGLIQRPTNFDPSRKYPVIEYIYAGPGDAYTPKSFTPLNWTTQPLAELGFIVVQLDAMGTSYRGKSFEDICYKNLRDAGLPDRIAWIKAAAAKYNYMDTTRVGIFGASAGGQESTAAVLFHPEFYKAAYSSCGCHDNRMDKIWWNEQWMGYPVDSSYVKSSNTANASLLRRPLMLVVGEVDDNVDPSSTLQLAAALIKANKNFELVVLPGVRHTMGERYGEHKRYDFFVKHLLGVDPPEWTDTY